MAAYARLERDVGALGFDVLHCEQPDCHEIYMPEKNGAACDQCQHQVCEVCSCDPARGNTVDDEWYCADCCTDLVRDGSLIQCSNTAIRCMNYAFARDFACIKCSRVACDECFGAVFGRGKNTSICVQCVHRKTRLL